MQVYSDKYGNRIVPPYAPYIDRQEEGINVSIFTPEASHNSGLYNWNQVNELTGNSYAGTFQDEAQLAKYYYGLKPFSERETISYAATLPDIRTTTPRHMFMLNEKAFIKAPYRRLKDIYG